MGRLIFAFQCEMELDYNTVSRLLLVPVVNVCESRICFSYLSEFILAAILRSAALCMTSKYLTYVVCNYSFNSTHTCPAATSEFCTDFLL